MVGTAEADRLALSGAMLAPPEALRVGLVDQVVPNDSLMVSIECVCQAHACQVVCTQMPFGICHACAGLPLLSSWPVAPIKQGLPQPQRLPHAPCPQAVAEAALLRMLAVPEHSRAETKRLLRGGFARQWEALAEEEAGPMWDRFSTPEVVAHLGALLQRLSRNKAGRSRL